MIDFEILTTVQAEQVLAAICKARNEKRAISERDLLEVAARAGHTTFAHHTPSPGPLPLENYSTDPDDDNEPLDERVRIFEDGYDQGAEKVTKELLLDAAEGRLFHPRQDMTVAKSPREVGGRLNVAKGEIFVRERGNPGTQEWIIGRNANLVSAYFKPCDVEFLTTSYISTSNWVLQSVES
ncbi:MAG: hypothetical protein M1835_005386 [Candelina submexicana]|nr:MAG: hypothetical protein M1835_005386 [Candelina submexicana]